MITDSIKRQWSGRIGIPDRKNTILSLAKYSGLFMLSRLLTARRIRILAWHGVWLGESHFGNFLFISEGKFARRLDLLEKWGYPIMSLTELLKGRKGRSLPALSTAITIDDGWFGTYKFMLPELERHGFPATVYLTTYYCVNQAPVTDVALTYCFHAVDVRQCPEVHVPSFDYGPLPISTQVQRNQALKEAFEIVSCLGNDLERQTFLRALFEEMDIDYRKIMVERWFHLMSPAEVADAADRGMRFELHTHRHRTSHAGRDCLRSEITVNRSLIEDMAGQDTTHFCYPCGVFSTDNWNVLRDCEISSATTTRVGLVDKRSSDYALPRILDGESISELEFEAEMSGFIQLTRDLRKAWSVLVKKASRSKFGAEEAGHTP